MTTDVYAAAPRSTRRVPRAARDVALGLAVLAVGVGVVILDAGNAEVGVPAGPDFEPGWPAALAGLVQVVPGVLLLRRVPRQPIGVVLAASGTLWMLDALAASWFVHALFVAPGVGGGAAAGWWSLHMGAFVLLGLPLVLLLFPDGRLPRGPVGRPAAWLSLASTAVLPLVLVVVPSGVTRAFQGEEPAPILATVPTDAVSVAWTHWPPVLTVAYLLLPLSLILPFVTVLARYRAARGERRLQLRWLVWAALVAALVMGLARPLPSTARGALVVLAVALVSGAVVVAVTRYRLYAIERLLPSTLVSVLLALMVLGVDLLVLAVAGRVLGDRDSALLAVAVVAVAYTPLRTRLWDLARRLVHGSRDDPYGAVATLAERLESAAAADQQLAALARSVAEAFRLPYVRVEIDRPDGGRAHVEHGRPVAPTVELPVRYRDEPIGRVVLSRGGRPLSQGDQRLLGDLLRQAAGAARAGALGASLQRTRVALVTAREEERRRLRRDLHDSLGPGLGAITLRVETARELAPADPVAADRVLEEVTGDVAGLLTDVRRLVHDLRPPALDEVWLAHAVRQQAERLSVDDRATGTVITVEAADPALAEPGALPAAVEVAAFRITSEALTNVVRHAAAARAVVALRREGGDLVVEVTDDGRGIGADVPAGVGTASMRERAAELGGSSTVTCPPGGGTLVAARLPMGTVAGVEDDG